MVAAKAIFLLAMLGLVWASTAPVSTKAATTAREISEATRRAATTRATTRAATTVKATTKAASTIRKTTARATTKATTVRPSTARATTTRATTTRATTTKATTVRATTKKATTRASTVRVTTRATTVRASSRAATTRATTRASTTRATSRASTTTRATTRAATTKATTVRATTRAATTKATTARATTRAATTRAATTPLATTTTTTTPLPSTTNPGTSVADVTDDATATSGTPTDTVETTFPSVNTGGVSIVPEAGLSLVSIQFEYPGDFVYQETYIDTELLIVSFQETASRRRATHTFSIYAPCTGVNSIFTHPPLAPYTGGCTYAGSPVTTGPEAGKCKLTMTIADNSPVDKDPATGKITIRIMLVEFNPSVCVPTFSTTTSTTRTTTRTTVRTTTSTTTSTTTPVPSFRIPGLLPTHVIENPSKTGVIYTAADNKIYEALYTGQSGIIATLPTGYVMRGIADHWTQGVFFVVNMASASLNSILMLSYTKAASDVFGTTAVVGETGKGDAMFLNGKIIPQDLDGAISLDGGLTYRLFISTNPTMYSFPASIDSLTQEFLFTSGSTTPIVAQTFQTFTGGSRFVYFSSQFGYVAVSGFNSFPVSKYILNSTYQIASGFGDRNTRLVTCSMTQGKVSYFELKGMSQGQDPSANLVTQYSVPGARRGLIRSTGQVVVMGGAANAGTLSMLPPFVLPSSAAAEACC
eukprot:m.121680 g.121680  ORF g.121680 m.121680 type:complete len:704 (-) comp14584_c0_seq1:78-2189(-)